MSGSVGEIGQETGERAVNIIEITPHSEEGELSSVQDKEGEVQQPYPVQLVKSSKFCRLNTKYINSVVGTCTFLICTSIYLIFVGKVSPLKNNRFVTAGALDG